MLIQLNTWGLWYSDICIKIIDFYYCKLLVTTDHPYYFLFIRFMGQWVWDLFVGVRSRLEWFCNYFHLKRYTLQHPVWYVYACRGVRAVEVSSGGQLYSVSSSSSTMPPCFPMSPHQPPPTAVYWSMAGKTKALQPPEGRPRPSLH